MPSLWTEIRWQTLIRIAPTDKRQRQRDSALFTFDFDFFFAADWVLYFYGFFFLFLFVQSVGRVMTFFFEDDSFAQIQHDYEAEKLDFCSNFAFFQ